LRTPLPHDLGPGNTAQLKAAIQTPSRAGEYKLEVTLVQEFVAWFPERDGEKLALSVNVSDAKAQASDVNRVQPLPEADSALSRSKKPPLPAQATVSQVGEGKAEGSQRQETPPNPVTARADKGAKERDPHVRAWSVQVGSYAKEQEARNLVRQLKNKGYDSYVDAADVQGKRWHRVRVGRLASRTEAEKLQKTLREAEGLKRTILARPR